MDNKKLFVGSLPWAASSDDLKTFFAQAGAVISAQVITDRDTGKSRGFGFVEMSSVEEAENAAKNLNGADFNGRKIVVNIARPREERR